MDGHTLRECGLRVRAFTWIYFCVKCWPFTSHCFQSRIRLRGKIVGRVKKVISWKNYDVGTGDHHRDALFFGFISECTRTISQVLGRFQFAPFRWILMQLSLPFGVKNGTRCAYDKEEHVTNTINAMHVCRWRITRNVCARLWESGRVCMKKQRRRTWQFYLFILWRHQRTTILRTI